MNPRNHQWRKLKNLAVQTLTCACALLVLAPLLPTGAEPRGHGLGADRRGRVTPTSGYFGAMQLLADIEARFRVPSGGGRPTDPAWTEVVQGATAFLNQARRENR